MDGKMSVKVCESAKYLCKLDKKNLCDLENELGVSKGYIARCKKGMKHLSIDCCCKIADYFGVTVNDLISNNYVDKMKLLQIEELKKKIEELEKEMDK